MANPLKGETAIDIGGVSYTLKLSYNSLCEAETQSGKTSTELMGELEGGSMTAIRLLFWASLLASSPKMTISQAGDLIDEATPAKVMSALTTCIRAAFGANDAEAEGETENPQ